MRPITKEEQKKVSGAGASAKRYSGRRYGGKRPRSRDSK